MNLSRVFIEFKSGNRKSKLKEKEDKKKKLDISKENNKKNAEKDKKQKSELKEKCPHCQGTGIEPGTEISQKGPLNCHFCLGRGYIKKRKKLDLKVKSKRREGKLIGKKSRRRIIKLFLNGLTDEEIADKVNIETWLIKQVIKDLKDELEESLNKNN